jgi:hypothetical protein
MSLRIRAYALFTLLVACVAMAQTPPPTAKGAWLLLPDRVWTGDGDAAHPGWAVLVRDGAIVAAGPAAQLDAGDAQRLELPGATLQQRVIDAP